MDVKLTAPSPAPIEHTVAKRSPRWLGRNCRRRAESDHMATIIPLTSTSNAGKKIYVNLDLVKSFIDREKHEGTVLRFPDGTEISVAEKPAEVHEAVNELRRRH
jgi:hypothetical protein